MSRQSRRRLSPTSSATSEHGVRGGATSIARHSSILKPNSQLPSTPTVLPSLPLPLSLPFHPISRSPLSLPQPLVAASAACVVAQCLKPVIAAAAGDGFNWRLVFKSGGMPSSHSAVRALPLAPLPRLLPRSAAPLLPCSSALLFPCFLAPLLLRPLSANDQSSFLKLFPSSQTTAIQSFPHPRPAIAPPPSYVHNTAFPCPPTALPPSPPCILTLLVPARSMHWAMAGCDSSGHVNLLRAWSIRRSLWSNSSVCHHSHVRRPGGAGSSGEASSATLDGIDWDDSRISAYISPSSSGSDSESSRLPAAQRWRRSRSFWAAVFREPAVVEGEVEVQEIGQLEGWRNVPLKESVGHTKAEVVGGAVAGVLLSLLIELFS
ncbi:unnamed protein product [Closterium sp. Naga37s-1]|nr:unnamed protein product [Closterium sp. Naga37s-1]